MDVQAHNQPFHASGMSHGQCHQLQRPLRDAEAIAASSPRIVRAVAYRWSCSEAAGRKVWEVTQADYDRNVAYYTPTNSTSQLAAGGARHRPV